MKPIPGYEGRYSVDALGRIWAHPKKSRSVGRFLKPMTTKCGYLYVTLLRETGRYRNTYPVHRLVALAWTPPNGKPHVNHKNGIKTDNRPENLEWVTPKENKLHAYATGITKPNLEQIAQARTKLVRGEKGKYVRNS